MRTKNDLGIRIRRRIKIIVNGIYIYGRNLFLYLKYSNVNYSLSENNYIAIIIGNYHVIEKGLTMPDFRFGFGRDRLLCLMNDLIKYRELNFSIENVQYQHAMSVVKEYFELHQKAGYKLASELNDLYRELLGNMIVVPSEQKKISRDVFFSDVESPFPVFSASRHSVRNFSNEDVDLNNIRSAVELAQNTPTPCNRQPNKVYLVSDKAKIKEILELQGGTRGFGHLANQLLVITSDMSVFASVREANEVYKSGGMYTMNLLYALHYYKIGACTLQWGEQPSKDKMLRRALKIPRNEVVIMMLLLGIPADEFKIANSCRNKLASVLRICN